MKEKYIKDFNAVKDLIGHIPKREEYRLYGAYSSKMIENEFGSYGNALKEIFYEYYQSISTHNCTYCDKIIKNRKRKGNIFCNRSCSASYNNIGINRHKSIKSGIILKNGRTLHRADCEKNRCCLFCGNNLRYKRSLNTMFCNRKCHIDHKYKVAIDKWKQCPESANTFNGVSATIRRYIFSKFDNKCSRCGWCEVNEVTGNSPLELEHIDGDYTNNSEENLTILCPNCHSLTKTYKALNVGNGRSYRRKRYKEGKSF